MKRLRRLLKRIFCRHYYAYYGLVPVPGGQVVEVKCDLCGARRCGRALVWEDCP